MVWARVRIRVLVRVRVRVGDAVGRKVGNHLSFLMQVWVFSQQFRHMMGCNIFSYGKILEKHFIF